MEKSKKVINILEIIAAGILSFLLVITLVATPAVTTASSFFKTKNLQKVLTSIDYSQLITSKMGLEKLDGISSLGNGLVERLMETEMMEEIIEIYVDNAFAYMDGKSEKESLTATEIQNVAEKHIDELVDILNDYLGDRLNLSENIVEEMARLVAKEYSNLAADIIPSVKELGLTSKVTGLITNLRNGTYSFVVLGAAAILTILIMLCRIKGLKGFMWIGIDYFAAAAGSLIFFFIVRGLDASALVGDSAIGISIVSAMKDIVVQGILIGAGILALLGAIFIAVFLVEKKLFKKKSVVIQSEAVSI